MIEFVNQLVKEGKLRQLCYPWNDYYQIVEHPTLMLRQNHVSYCEYTTWDVWTYKYTIHVKRLDGPLQTEWAKLDYVELEERQRKLDYDFSLTPDY